MQLLSFTMEAIIMTEQVSENQLQVESEKPTTEKNEGKGFLLPLGSDTADSLLHSGMANNVSVPLAIELKNDDKELGSYSQIVAFYSFAGISLYLYGLVEIEQDFKEKGVMENMSEEEREVLSILFSANDYLKDAGIVSESTITETKAE